jgi:hypothetical protein
LLNGKIKAPFNRLNNKIMALLDISGTGLFSHSGQATHVLTEVFKILAGSAGILILAFWSLIAIVIRSIYMAVLYRSPFKGFYTFLRLTAYGIGAVLALVFILLAAVFFSIAWYKILLIAAFITVITAFIARETFMFLIFKRVGKFLFYFATLREIGKVISNNGNEEKTP